MELYTLKYAPGAKKRKKRVGRGPSSGHGKTSTRGHKGAQARAGYRKKPGFEGGQMPLHRRLPKRGFRHVKRYPMAPVNVSTIEMYFEAGSVITSEDLIKRKFAKKLKGGVKILGGGEITKPVHLIVQAISPSAKQKIESVGGKVEIKPFISDIEFSAEDSNINVSKKED